MRRAIYILIPACSFFFNAKAQDKNNVDVDSVVETVKSPNPEPEETLSVDSSLTLNRLTISADSVESWKNLSAFAYAKYLDSLLKAKQEKEKAKVSQSPEQEGPGWFDSLLASPVTRVILWTLAAGFIVFVLYKLFLGGGGPFKKRSRAILSTGPEVTEEQLTSESDFDALIGQSVKNGNYRLAIRYQYLKLLHRLADKHFIEMAADKTNYQYVRELAGRGPAVNQQFQNDFASLTLNYEYVWYGEFTVDDTVYRRIETGFNQFNQKI